MTGAPAGGRSRLHRWLLLALLLWAFLLRAWFAAWDPGPERFYDERYSVENVVSLVEEGRLRPANGWYPGLSYLPQALVLAALEGLHRLTGISALQVLRSPGDRTAGGLTPAGYLASRWLVALYGVATLVLLYLLGRRLAISPSAALLGVLLLAVTPAHIRLSAVFKPDMLLTLLTLAAFLAALEVAERPTTGRFLLAGAAVGLAASAKLPGLMAAWPVVLVAGALAWRGRTLVRTLAPLLRGTGAALAAAAVFLALNPFPALQVEYLERNLRIYGERAELAGLDRADAFRATFEHLLSPGFHGPVVGLLALGGLVGLGLRASRGRKPEGGREWLPLLVPFWVLGYLGIYAATTAYPKANNLLPVVPFTALAAGWFLVAAGSALVGRLPALDRPTVRTAVRWGAVVALLLVLLPPAHLYAYRVAVPSTRERVVAALNRVFDPLAGRLVIHRGERPPELLTRREAVAVWSLGSEAEAGPGVRRLSDAEVILGEPPAGAAGRGEVRVFEPSWGRAWGPTRTLVLHPWRLRARIRVWAEEGAMDRGGDPGAGGGGWPSWSLPLPESVEDGQVEGEQPAWLSVQVLVRDPEEPPVGPRLEVAGRPVRLFRTRVETGGYLYGWAYTSLRFRRAPGERLRVRLPPDLDSPRPPVADVLAWEDPAGSG